MKRGFIIFSVLVWAMIAGEKQISAQKTDCSSGIKTADVYYQAGSFGNCINILENALDSCKLTRKDKEHALEMLARAYFETGENDKAESTTDILLKNFPHYELKEEENPEMFNRTVKKYEIHPLLTIGAKNTLNWLRHKVISSPSVLSTIDYSQTRAERGYWFTYYGFAEFEFIKDVSFSVELMTFWSNYSREIIRAPSFSLSYSESDDFLEFPVYLKKYFHPAKNVLLYAAAGFGPFINYRAAGSVTLSYKKADIATTGIDADYEGGLYRIDVLPIKNTLVGQWNAGLGVGYTIKNLRFFLDARCLQVTKSVTAPEKSDNIPELKNDFYYIDQEMKINQIEVGATISYTLFNSVKRVQKK